MIHGRPDYNRIQDPAAEPAVYRLIGSIAHLLASAEAECADEPGDNPGSRSLVAVAKLGAQLADLVAGADVEELRAFAARAELPAQLPAMRPIGDDEPVFLLRAQDEAAARAVLVYASLAERRAGPGVARGAREQSARMASWAATRGIKDADLPGGVQNRLQPPLPPFLAEG